MSVVEFHDLNPPATEQQLAELEAKLKRPLPPEFRDFLKQHHAARPSPNNFDLPSGETVAVECFFGIIPATPEWDIQQVIEKYESEYPKDTFPIGEIAGGGLLVMDKEGRLLFWDNNEDFLADEPEPVTSKVYPVANSIKELLASMFE